MWARAGSNCARSDAPFSELKRRSCHSQPSPRAAVGRVDAEGVGVGGFPRAPKPPTPDPSPPLRGGRGAAAPHLWKDVRLSVEVKSESSSAIRRSSHLRYRLADHRRSRPPRHPRRGDRGRRAARSSRSASRPRSRRSIPRAADDRRPQHRGDAGLRRLPPAFVVPALARARRRGQRPVVPVRPHVSVRGRARRRGRAALRHARRRRTAQARRHLLRRSRQLSSRRRRSKA